MRQPGPTASPAAVSHARVGVIPGDHGANDRDRVEGWLLFGDGSIWPVRRNVVIGRSPSPTHRDVSMADRIVVRDPAVSRRHLALDLADELPTFRDEASRNGSWIVVNSVVRGPLSPSTVAVSGLEVVFGGSSVRWVVSVGSDDPPAGYLHSQTRRALARTVDSMRYSPVEGTGGR